MGKLIMTHNTVSHIRDEAMNLPGSEAVKRARYSEIIRQYNQAELKIIDHEDPSTAYVIINN
jgi:hypothetical protein